MIFVELRVISLHEYTVNKFRIYNEYTVNQFRIRQFFCLKFENNSGKLNFRQVLIKQYSIRTRILKIKIQNFNFEIVQVVIMSAYF